MRPPLQIHAVLLLAVDGAFCIIYPNCFTRGGECLDRNQPPLDITNRMKPKENQNVIKAVDNIFTMDDCLSACEMETECAYFTLYSANPKKECYLVGFNLGNPCTRLGDVCVLYRQCAVFNTSCDGQDCRTGRRLIQDMKEEWHTLVLGGTKDDRANYETSGELLDNEGSACSKSLVVAEAEGAAGIYLRSSINRWRDSVLVCGGYSRLENYRTNCQTMTSGTVIQNTTQSLNTARAFHSMVAVRNVGFAFGGYNDVAGMLDSIEVYDETIKTWSISTAKLPSPRSHTCAVSLMIGKQSMIFVMGGWSSALVYLPDVVKYNVLGSDLTLDTTVSLTLPPDRLGADPGRSDMACTYYRSMGWYDGILLTGGYRSRGAWLNTVWFLNLTRALDPTNQINPWVRFADLSQAFNGGRHNHGITLLGYKPLIVGGWKNYPLDTTQLFDECDDRDAIGSSGTWTTNYSIVLQAGREKFGTVPVPLSMLAASLRCP